MKIKVDLFIGIFLLFFILTNQIEVYALVMIFALIHELSHLVCGIIFGFKPEIFRINPLGYSIEFRSNPIEYNRKVFKSNRGIIREVIIALSGPLINLIIVIIGIIFNVNEKVIYSNLIILTFNLIPIYPLDGGRILKGVLKVLCGNKKANRYINKVTNIFFIILLMVSSVLIMLYKNIAIFVLILFLGRLVVNENRNYFTYEKIYKIIDKKNKKI